MAAGIENQYLVQRELELIIWIYAVVGSLWLPSAALLQMAITKVVSVAIFRSSLLNREFWEEFMRNTVGELGI